MSEENKTVVQAVEQPSVIVSPPAEQTQGTTDKQPEYVTREEAQRMAEEAAREVMRKAQSMYDKGNANILRKVQGELQAISKAIELQRGVGIEVTAEQEDRLKQQVINRALSTPDPEQPQPDTKPMPQGESVAGDEELIRSTTAKAMEIMQTAGVVVEDSDPEASMIVQTTPEAFLQSVRDAVAAKQERIAMPPAGRVAGVPGASAAVSANPIANITNPDVLIRMGLSGK